MRCSHCCYTLQEQTCTGRSMVRTCAKEALRRRIPKGEGDLFLPLGDLSRPFSRFLSTLKLGSHVTFRREV